MKTADEVAEEIVKGMEADGDCSHEAVGRIAQALTAYAEERVKEALNAEESKFKLRLVLQRTTDLTQAFDDGLEEAAKVAEDFIMSDGDHGTEISVAIRALKEPK